MKNRTPIPKSVVNDLLFQTDMRCCICRCTQEVQIHHIDGSPSNNSIHNLITLCVFHHGIVSGKSGFGRNWSPDLLQKYKSCLIKDVAEARSLSLKMGAVFAAAAIGEGAKTYEFNLGVVYEEHFEEFFRYTTNVEAVLRAVTYKEIRGLWTTEKGRFYLKGNIDLLTRGRTVKRLFVLDRPVLATSFVPTIREALKQEFLGIQVRILLRDEYIDTITQPNWDMFGVHDNQFLTFYKVENETVLAGVIPFKDKARDAIDMYEAIFHAAMKPRTFCDRYKVYLKPKEMDTVMSEANMIVKALREQKYAD